MMDTPYKTKALRIFFIVVCIVFGFYLYKYSFSSITRLTTSDLSRSQIVQLLKRTGLRIKHLLNTTTRACATKAFGQVGSNATLSWGAHKLCNIPPQTPCLFYSFGISHDYNFDMDLANSWHCQGLAFDPSVEHKSRLHPNVTFHMIAAKTLSEEDDRQWPLVMSVTALKTCFKHKRIHILKMDCEGCEFSLAHDIENEMPNFFSTIDQMTLEIHVSKFWMKTWTHIINLAKLFKLLENNDLRLVDAELTPCASYHEDFGCPPILMESEYPCGPRIMCQNLLFARIEQRPIIKT